MWHDLIDAYNQLPGLFITYVPSLVRSLIGGALAGLVVLFGSHKHERLAAFFNLILILYISGSFIYVAFDVLFSSQDLMVVLIGIGLGVAGIWFLTAIKPTVRTILGIRNKENNKSDEH